MSKKIVLLMPYFGAWPEWFSLYLESCRWNSTIDWIFFTDCEVPESAPNNTKFISMSFADYQKLVSERLNIDFTPSGAYKICDLRPAFGVIHAEHIAGYDYFGFSDVDVIYGDLRAFYTDEVLTYNTLSTHKKRVSGHLFLMKNDDKWINAFRRIPNWQALMSHPQYQSMDEISLAKVLQGKIRLPYAVNKVLGWFDTYKHNHLFQERHSTIFSEAPWIDGSYNFPEQWVWSNGKLTTDQGQEMMYLHFMNWKSSRYLKAHYGQQSAWERLPRLIEEGFTDFSQGFCISPSGFSTLKGTDEGTGRSRQQSLSSVN
jgi:hypothetical protein